MKKTCLLILALWGSSAALASEEPGWKQTLETISTGVVSIQIDGDRAFDTEWNITSQATGFVVDRELGLILTNRHVVMPGPVTAQAVFLDQEEVELKPIYRDPVHDFGFFRFDPEALQYLEPYEFPLRPDKAQVGRDVRIVGNDAGEQISILAGTIAKLDREAPLYGRGKYNDFNTFYVQAASGTSGGSSGSPVVDVDGDAVALNAGAKAQAASSFFLPLDRVERALELIRAGLPVTRGTIQTVFGYTPYDELRRLGLRDQTEARVRAQRPGQHGMLVVSQVVPGGPAAGRLEPGDILISVNGDLITQFAALEAVLDDGVGDTVTMEVQRGGERFAFDLKVQNLHAVTPARYLQVSDAVLNTLSYQQARSLNMPVTGVWIANPGYMFASAAIPRGSVITAVGGVPVKNLDDFQALIDTLEDGERFVVRYFTFDDPQTSKLRSVRMDRRWYPADACHRDDQAGVWPCKPLPKVGRAGAPDPASTRFTANGDPRARKIAPSLVMVNFDMPYVVSGVSERHYHGTGLVVDARLGLVVVDRNTVPVSLGDVSVTIAGTLEVPGQVEYIHPLHNLAVISYDPALIGDTPVESARFSPKRVDEGDQIWLAGLQPNSKPFIQETQVAGMDAVTFPLSRTLRFRDTNLEAISIVNAPTGLDGVLLDRKGRVVAMWSSFAFHGANQDPEQVTMGTPADLVSETLELVRSGATLHSLEAEFALLPLSSARDLGLPQDWAEKLEKHDPEKRQTLQIVRLVAGSPADESLRPGDLLLAMDGTIVNDFRDVEKLTLGERVRVTIWRGDRAMDLDIETVALEGRGLDRIVVWAGAILQAPHRAMAAQRSILRGGVYVAFFSYGSPASRYRLWAGRRIVEVDGQPTPDLDAFIRAVSGKRGRDSVRIKVITWNNQVGVITLKLDDHYWPPYELRYGDGEWERISLQ